MSLPIANSGAHLRHEQVIANSLSSAPLVGAAAAARLRLRLRVRGSAFGGGDRSGGGALKCDGDGTIGCAFLACANRCRVPSSLGCK